MEDELGGGGSVGEGAGPRAWRSVERADLPEFVGKDDKGRLRFRGNCIRKESVIVEKLGLEGYAKTRLGYRSKPGSELRTPEEMKESGLWDHAQRRVPNETQLERHLREGWGPRWKHEREDGSLGVLTALKYEPAIHGAQDRAVTEALMKQVADETSKGYSIVVTLAAAQQLKNFALSPIMIRKQVKEDGTVKYRPLRDVSRSWSSWEGREVSVNDLIDMDDLRHRAKVRCAEALPGILLALLEMVCSHPGEPISLAKADVGSCFFRFHTRLDQVPLFASPLTKDYVLLPLRQVQGSRSSPSFCPILTEALCSMFSDSDLSACETTEACPHQEWVREEIDERPQRGFPFGLKKRKGRATAGHHAEAYVDDALLAYLSKDYEAASTSFLRCLYKAYRPCTAGEDADFRPSPAAENKRDDFVARGAATFLGLVVDARELTVTVSQARADSIVKLLEEVFGEEGHWVEAGRLAQVTGRLTHASMCRVGGRAEMSAIWRILSCCPVKRTSRGKYHLQLLPEMRKRVEEWKAFLASPVPMPLCYVPQIMDRLVPTHIGYTDASGFGMGGFFVANRVVHVWRLAFPTGTTGAIIRKKGDGGNITINELELLGVVCQCSLLEHVLTFPLCAAKWLLTKQTLVSITSILIMTPPLFPRPMLPHGTLPHCTPRIMGRAVPCANTKSWVPTMWCRATRP
jgi:hypothetical protein